MTEAEWEFFREYGGGCKVFVDKKSLSVSGDIVRVGIKHFLVPPGTDKRNQKPVREIVFDKEFDLDRAHARYHSITFTYMDGSVAAPLRTEPEWIEADKGSLAELNYVRTLVRPNKKRWWKF